MKFKKIALVIITIITICSTTLYLYNSNQPKIRKAYKLVKFNTIYNEKNKSKIDVLSLKSKNQIKLYTLHNESDFELNNYCLVSNSDTVFFQGEAFDTVFIYDWNKDRQDEIFITTSGGVMQIPRIFNFTINDFGKITPIETSQLDEIAESTLAQFENKLITDQNKFAIEQIEYTEIDPMCCPTGKKSVNYFTLKRDQKTLEFYWQLEN
jgi:hypothetical protein